MLQRFSLPISFLLGASTIAASGCLFQLEDSGESNSPPTIPADAASATERFTVLLDDVSPTPWILQPYVPLTRLNGHTSILFEFIAGDSTTDGEFIPRHHLEYQYQLLADNKYCSAHLSDPFTEWTNFPEHGAVIVGGEPPTLYNDLYSMDCVWVFTLRVRDPNGNIGTDTRLVYQSVGRE